MEKYNAIKQSLDFQRQEFDKALILKRTGIIDMYEKIRKIREEMEVKKVSMATDEKNRKRRVKRCEEKAARLRVD